MQQSQCTVASITDGITGENEIAKMWEHHYKSLLNIVETFCDKKHNSIRGELILFLPLTRH